MRNVILSYYYSFWNWSYLEHKEMKYLGLAFYNNLNMSIQFKKSCIDKLLNTSFDFCSERVFNQKIETGK